MEKENQYPKNVYEYEEIDLREIVNNLIKQKKIIFFCTAAGLMAAMAANAIMPQIYRAQTKIEVGLLAESDGKALPVVDAAQLQDKIEQGVYGADEESSCLLKTASVAGSNIITINADCADPMAAKNLLLQITKIIISDHEKIITAQRQAIESQINNYQISAEEIKSSLQHVADGNCSAERYLAASTLKNHALELEFALLRSVSTAVILAPDTSETPIKPNRGINILVGLIMGLFLGIFAALVNDWWLKSGVKSK